MPEVGGELKQELQAWTTKVRQHLWNLEARPRQLSAVSARLAYIEEDLGALLALIELIEGEGHA